MINTEMATFDGNSEFVWKLNLQPQTSPDASLSNIIDKNSFIN